MWREPWFAFDRFSLARELVKGNPGLFNRGNHWRGLIEIAAELFKCSADRSLFQRWHLATLDHFAVFVLCACFGPEHHCAGIFLVLGHEQVLNLCPPPKCEKK